MFECKCDDGIYKTHPEKDSKSVLATALKPYGKEKDNHKYWHENKGHPSVDRYMKMQTIYPDMKNFHRSIFENLHCVPWLTSKPRKNMPKHFTGLLPLRSNKYR